MKEAPNKKNTDPKQETDTDTGPFHPNGIPGQQLLPFVRLVRCERKVYRTLCTL